MELPKSNETIVYEGENTQSINVLTDGETVWLSQAQMCQLFGRDRSVIAKHIKNAINEGEVSEKSNVQNLHIAKSDKPVKFYDLDVIISVGYRVKSLQGTIFRRWATRILKNILINRLTVDHRLETMESRLTQVEDGLAQLAEAISNPDPFYADDRRMIGFNSKGVK